MAEALQIAGNVVQGIAAHDAGKYNRDASYNAAIEEERAGNAEQTRIRAAARQAIGQQVAAQGENGFAQGTGSALDALAESQVNAAFDGLLARQQAAARARARRAEGDVAMAAGNNALLTGMMGAASKSIDWANDRRASDAGTSRRRG
ncbi:MAG: hypothetical protein P0Y64_02095 [Candidatus Sphingomonas colombiensis]|nr:hypothetical protein [Sphingomonas sp.]WEK43647.1 MAG: hypothetical protein P0Y64_02095 [Sphingomonas sp.]